MEQDYLCSSTAQTSRDLTVGPAWFAAMDAAAAEAAVDMQLCMMNPAHALASTLMHAASNVRRPIIAGIWVALFQECQR